MLNPKSINAYNYELKSSLGIIQDCSSKLIKSMDKALGNKTLEQLAKQKYKRYRKISIDGR